LSALAATQPVVLVTGARQTGKTSLVRRLFQSQGSVSLDLPSAAAQAEHDLALFLASHPSLLVIDEV
jgi:predicted AAA+ superfamily ATPase